MNTDYKIDVMRSFSEEIITEEELRQIFDSNEHPIAYDGFEPSGIAPIHFGLQRSRNIKKMMSIGIRFKLVLADYFAFVNNKLEGDLEKIRVAGDYFVEVWKAAGIDVGKIEIIKSSEMMNNLDYWDTVLKAGKAITLNRVKRAITIMGRKEGEDVSASQLIYPVMQVADIFRLDVDICQLGMDQRKADILAREVADKYGWKKPVAAHHPLILGLAGMPKDIKKDDEAFVEYKMSKSNPKNAIYVHDSHAEIKEKISKAYCPEKIIAGNPLLDYVKNIIVDNTADPIEIKRLQKFGGDISFDSYSAMELAYAEGKLHPLDLKQFVADKLEEKIMPIREHFEKDRHARELYEQLKGFRITR